MLISEFILVLVCIVAYIFICEIFIALDRLERGLKEVQEKIPQEAMTTKPQTVEDFWRD